MKVEVYKVNISQHKDQRRLVLAFSIPKKVKIPFKIKDLKMFKISDKAVKNKLVLGNHFHTKVSGCWELYFISGSFKFRFRKIRRKIQETIVKSGDACLIPPDWSHAFMPLKIGSQLLGLSNLSHNSKHNKKDKLF